MSDTLELDETVEEDRGAAIPAEVRARIEAEAVVSARAYHAELQRLSPRVEIRREPMVYERFQGHLPREEQASYFADVARAQISNDQRARARLERHAKEIAVESERLQQRRLEGAEFRVNPSRVTGGEFFGVPWWANEYFATAARAKRVYASMIPTFDLPTGVVEVNLPRIVEGTHAPGVSDVTPAPERDFTDAAVESWCETFAGQADCSMQQLEQSPATAALDVVVLKDLLESYDRRLEESLFTGTGKANQRIAGVLNLTTGAGGVSVVQYTGKQGYEMFAALSQVAAKLGDARNCPPEVWLMRTARWCYLGGAEDLQNLPLAVPGHQALPPVAYTFDDSRPAVAPPILGWPTFLSDAIPATLGAGKNRDVIVCARPTDSVLFESPKHTSVFKEVLSGTLQARFQLHGYAAALHRYPTGLAYMEGSGLEVSAEY